MKSTFKRILSYVLTVTMLISCMGITAFAGLDDTSGLSWSVDTNAAVAGSEEYVKITVTNDNKTPMAALNFYIYCDTDIFEISEEKYEYDEEEDDDVYVEGGIELKGRYNSKGGVNQGTIAGAIAQGTYLGIEGKDGYTILWNSTDGENVTPANNNVMVIYLLVKAGVVNGDYTIELDCAEALDANEQEVGLGFSGKETITVTGGVEAVPEVTLNGDLSQFYFYDYFKGDQRAQEITAVVTNEVTSDESVELAYQWYVKEDYKSNFTGEKEVEPTDFTAIEGATSKTYTPVDYDANWDDMEYTFYCEVTNTYNGKTYSGKSDEATLEVEDIWLMTDEARDLITIEFEEPVYTGEPVWPTTKGLKFNGKAVDKKDARVLSLGSNSDVVPEGGTLYSFRVQAESRNFFGFAEIPMWNILPAEITTSGSTAETVYVGGAAKTIGVTGSPVDSTELDVTYSTTSDLIILDEENGEVKAAGEATGEATVTVTFSDPNGNHTAKSVDVTVTVEAKQQANVTFAKISDGTYTGEGQALSSFVNAATGTPAGGEVTYTLDGEAATLATTIKDAGTYTVVAYYESETHAGSATQTITIAPAALAIDNAVVSGKEYDGTIAATVTSVEFSGFVGHDTAVDYAATAVFADANAATNKTATVTVTLDESVKNYTLSNATTTAKADITAKPVTVTGVKVAGKTYDGTTAVNTNDIDVTDAVVNGVIEGDTVTVIATNATAEYNSKDVDGCNYATVSGLTLSSGNYVIDTTDPITAETSITPKTVNVQWANTTLTYNGSAQAPTATAATGIAGEELVVSVSGAQKNKGTYTAEAGITDTNYVLSENTKTTQFTIAALQVFVTISDIADQTYNTQQIKPAVTISAKDAHENPVSLTENTDYTVSYGDNTNVAAGGSVTVTSVATSNYTFTAANKTFVIKASDNVTLANENVNTQNVVVGVGTFADPVFIGISGEAVNGTLTYSYNELTDKAKIQEALAALTKGDTAQVAYTFVASGNYAKTINGTIDVTMVDIIFTVNGVAADASNAVTIKADPTYGDTWAQIVTIGNIVASVDGTEVPGTFTLSVSGTPDAGTRTYNVKFTSDNGKYTNVNVFTTDASVEIAKKSVAVEWSNTTKTYNGETQRPSASAVGVNSEQIVLNISCAVATKNAGTYTFTASTENNNYALTNTSTEFTIETKDIADAAITLGEALTYTGIEQTQTIESVTVDGLTVTYTVEGDKATDAGSYTLTVKGNGNFSGEATKGYTVAQKAITPDIVVEGTYKFTGSALTIVYTVKDGETVLAASDYTGSVTNNLNAGKATITVTANADGNYSFETATKQVDIAKADAKDLADIERSQKYTVTDGTVSVGNGGMPANAGTLTYAAGSESVVGTTVVADWSVDANGNVSYELSNPVAGDVVTLPVVISSQNYEDSTVNVVITIIEKDVPAVSANDITVTYNGSAVPESKITGTATFEGVTVTGSWSFKDAAPVNVADSGTVKVVFTPDDTTNYAVVETEITVTIKKATPTGAPTYNMVTGNGHTLAEAGLAMGTIQPAGGTLAWELGDDAIIEEGVAYTWIYTPVDTDNYNVLTGTAVLCRNTPPAPVVRPSNPVKPGGDKPGDSDEPTLPPVASELPFADVNTDTPCYESIAYVYENGLMNGVGNDQFAPNGTLNRAMVVTVLHRLEGAPEAAAASFTDVPAGQWYTGAVAWAAEKGVVNGYGDGKFGSEDAVTIQQLAVILYRYALLKGYDVTAVADLSIYADAAGVADWALAAMQWAVAEGLLTLDSNLLNAGATATRAQVAYALHHFMVNVIA